MKQIIIFLTLVFSLLIISSGHAVTCDEALDAHADALEKCDKYVDHLKEKNRVQEEIIAEKDALQEVQKKEVIRLKKEENAKYWWSAFSFSGASLLWLLILL
jgi:hypothetical protein